MTPAWSDYVSKSWEGSGVERANGGAPLRDGAGGRGDGARRGAGGAAGVGRLGQYDPVQRAAPRSLPQPDDPLRPEAESSRCVNRAHAGPPDGGEFPASPFTEPAPSGP